MLPPRAPADLDVTVSGELAKIVFVFTRGSEGEKEVFIQITAVEAATSFFRPSTRGSVKFSGSERKQEQRRYKSMAIVYLFLGGKFNYLVEWIRLRAWMVYNVALG